MTGQQTGWGHQGALYSQSMEGKFPGPLLGWAGRRRFSQGDRRKSYSTPWSSCPSLSLLSATHP